MKHNLNAKVSALIITLNEEDKIETLLTDLDFVDEIIVVDSFSTDKTPEICKSFETVTFIQNKFENYSSQRNFAITQAKNDWILFLDADERMTPELKNEIIITLKTNDYYSAFFFSRTFMFKNKVLRFSGNQNDKIFRLFNKNHARYITDKLIHEKLDVKGKIGFLESKLLHYSYSNFVNYKEKVKHYGILKAQEKLKKGHKSSFLMMILHPLYTFLYKFIIRLGFLDGSKGIIICYLNAYSVFVRYKELKRITSSRI